ncbi:hypothetical protein FQN49_002352 [Arthroderma sp. PD_2]|nr:hypothetical protein FQN49_002352 [Arthroderma sp. PD_2]
MPLDTSTTYRLTRLRLDGRRWNELRLLQAQISTNPASSGSSYLSMGNTAVLCTVHGPAEGKRSETAGATGAVINVVVNLAGFANIDRKKKSAAGGGGGDRQATIELANSIRDAFQPHIHAHLYPRSTISIHVSVLSSDGSLFAACLNACTLALVDAGIPMPGLLCACTVGMSGRASTPAVTAESAQVGGTNESLDPLLDISAPEEVELPYMTVANTNPMPDINIPRGGNDEDDKDEDGYDAENENQMLSIVHMDSGVHVSYLETMFAVGIDGCKQTREILNGVLKGAGKRVLMGEAISGPGYDE